MFAQTVGFNPAILHVVNPLPSVIWPLYLNYIVAVVFCQIIAAANCKLYIKYLLLSKVPKQVCFFYHF